MFLKELNDLVRQRLDDVARIARDGDDHAATAVARSEMPHLVDAVRTLMAGHTPNDRGECRACSRILWRWQKPWRRPTSPCKVYLDARLAILGEECDEARHALR